MSDSYKYPQLENTVVVDNDTAAGQDVFETKGATQRIFLERGTLSVFVAAVGGGGQIDIVDTSGNSYYSADVDEIKSLQFDWGDEGRQVTQGDGVQVVLSGAGTTQASVSCTIAGHYTTRR
jgi:hypothetical protein